MGLKTCAFIQCLCIIRYLLVTWKYKHTSADVWVYSGRVRIKGLRLMEASRERSHSQQYKVGSGWSSEHMEALSQRVQRKTKSGMG